MEIGEICIETLPKAVLENGETVPQTVISSPTKRPSVALLSLRPSTTWMVWLLVPSGAVSAATSRTNTWMRPGVPVAATIEARPEL